MLFVICQTFLQARFLSYISFFTVKNFTQFFFFRFLKICEGGNPEATICFAVI